jgi:hypothetical protein
LSSFRKKSADKQIVDETEDSFEEILKAPPDNEALASDRDENAKAKSENFSSKLKTKFRMNAKTNKKLSTSKTIGKIGAETCRHCLKTTGKAQKVTDKSFCVCVGNDDDVINDDGIYTSNLVYKDVSRNGFICNAFGMDCA